MSVGKRSSHPRRRSIRPSAKWWSRSSTSGRFEFRNLPRIAVHVKALAGSQKAGCAGADDGGDSKVPRDDRTMRKHAATFNDEPACVDEQGRPAGIGRRADKDVVEPEFLDFARIEDDPRR